MLMVVLGRVGKDSCRAEGMIKNFNTIEEFKKASKPEILQKIARTVIFSIAIPELRKMY